MAFAEQVRVAETTTSTGTGALTLAGALAGYSTFSSRYANGDTLAVFVTNDDQSEWEHSIATYSAGTVTRTTVVRSSNADAAVNFSAGTKYVYVDYPGLAKLIALATAKTGLADADKFPIADSAASDALKSATLAEIRKAVGLHAWVNFNGIGVVSIRDSFNVSSVADNSIGDATVNFATAAADANYTPLVTIGDLADASGSCGGRTNATRLVGSFRLVTLNASQSSNSDRSTVYVAVFH